MCKRAILAWENRNKKRLTACRRWLRRHPAQQRRPLLLQGGGGPIKNIAGLLIQYKMLGSAVISRKVWNAAQKHWTHVGQMTDFLISNVDSSNLDASESTVTVLWVRHCFGCHNMENISLLQKLSYRWFDYTSLCVQDHPHPAHISHQVSRLKTEVRGALGKVEYKYYSSILPRAMMTAQLVRTGMEETPFPMVFGNARELHQLHCSGLEETNPTPAGTWTFVPFAQKGSNVTLSQGGAVVTRGGNAWENDWENAVAAADESLSAGVHCWEVEITKQTNYIYVGVCKADVRPESGTHGLSGQRGKAWVMNTVDGALHPGRKHRAGEVPKGSRLGCKLDLGAGTLHFYKDGVKHGRWFTGIVGPVKRCVELYGQGDVVTLVRTKPAFAESSSPPTIQRMWYVAEKTNAFEAIPTFFRNYVVGLLITAFVLLGGTNPVTNTKSMQWGGGLNKLNKEESDKWIHTLNKLFPAHTIDKAPPLGNLGEQPNTYDKPNLMKWEAHVLPLLLRDAPQDLETIHEALELEHASAG